MIVAVICDVLGEENNGTTIAAMNLIRTLRAKGHQVRVVSPDANRVGEPGHYVVPTRNLGIFNNYVAKNGVSLAKPVRSILEAALDGVDVVQGRWDGPMCPPVGVLRIRRTWERNVRCFCWADT